MNQRESPPATVILGAGPSRPSPPSTVRLGGLEKPGLLQALRDHEVQLNEAAEALFADRRFIPLRHDRAVEIVTLSVGDLGFGEGAKYGQLAARALDLGLAQCPLELGPHLRMQFLNQAEGAAGVPSTHGRAPPGSITVASLPLDDSDERPKGFYLRRIHGVLWLRGYRSWPGHVWDPEDVFVFARSASAA